MRVRKFLVWTVVGLFVANVFALPRTLAAFGVRGGTADPTSLLLSSGCGCRSDGESTPSVEPIGNVSELTPLLSTTHPWTDTQKVQPLAAACIDVGEECISLGGREQYRCVNEWWMPTCFGQFERYKRWQYPWRCGNCYVVRCCPWARDGCCTRLDEPPCQQNYAPCAKPVCYEPSINCN